MDEFVVPTSPTPDAARSRASYALSQQVELASSSWPQPQALGVSRSWFELTYLPRFSFEASPFRLHVEFLLRAAVSIGTGSLQDDYYGSYVRSEHDGLQPLLDRQIAAVKQAYVGLSGPLELALGWQIPSWSKSDRYRPLDVFEVRDLTDWLRDETLGVLCASLAYQSANALLQVIWSPWSPTSAFAHRPENVWSILPRSEPQLSLAESSSPTFSLRHSEVGAAWAYNTQVADIALVAARSRDRVPSRFELALSADGATPELRAIYERFWMIGGAAAVPIGSYVTRLEAAYFRYLHNDPRLLRDGLRGVAGLERRWEMSNGRGSLLWTAQYLTDLTAMTALVRYDERASSPFRFFRHALTLSAVVTFSEQFSAAIKALAGLDTGGLLHSLELSFKPLDGLIVSATGDLIDGRGETVFGRLDHADRVLLTLEIHSNVMEGQQ